jgi:lipopolysaccharide export LptBFGC system permease protein LptF
MYWRRFAFPSMALVLGLAGAAIALTGSPRSRARSATLGIATVVGYYVLTRIADLIVVQYAGTPFWMAWLPNGMVLAASLLAILRSGRAKP